MRPTRLLAFSLFLLGYSTLFAQKNTQLSLAGTYGLVYSTFEAKQYHAIGGQIGLEMKFAKRFTLGGEFDTQEFDSDLAIAIPIASSGLPPVAYFINRRQFNLRLHMRYYFSKAFDGLFLGGFGGYGYFKSSPYDLPEEKNYNYTFDIVRKDLNYVIGFSYGYRLKLYKSLNASIFGTHQFGQDTLYSDRHQRNHQWGLGLNWLFNI